MSAKLLMPDGSVDFDALEDCGDHHLQSVLMAAVHQQNYETVTKDSGLSPSSLSSAINAFQAPRVCAARTSTWRHELPRIRR